MTSTIRPFTEADIPEVADLHRRVFHVRPESSPALLAAYRGWLVEVFLDPARREPGIDSLVLEDAAGAIHGFLGAVPRRVRIHGESSLAAVSTQLVVDESHRSQLAGVRLLRAFLSGPQDLSIADEAGDGARRLWEAMGGETAHLLSLGWTRPLAPCVWLATHLASRRSLGTLARAARPLARAADGLLARWPRNPLRAPAPEIQAEEASPEALAEQLPALVGRSLHVEPDPASLRWSLARAAEVLRIQPEIVILRGALGAPVGAYVHAPRAGAADETLLLAAAPPTMADTVAHLLHRAAERGATAVSGRLDRRMLPALAPSRTLFHRGKWFLVHARRPGLTAAFERGDALFSRLDGEMSLRFDPGEEEPHRE